MDFAEFKKKLFMSRLPLEKQSVKKFPSTF